MNFGGIHTAHSFSMLSFLRKIVGKFWGDGGLVKLGFEYSGLVNMRGGGGGFGKADKWDIMSKHTHTKKK